ncbi:regulatory protein RecX [Microbacterium radiodurans]|uniref:regulatory protein RecX n=1 Tax=Microbacterium radiodurans TaxID=661398 RepID=UPI001CC4B9D9|nr:regulatory protein RecX [Microbacterium radiodurans]
MPTVASSGSGSGASAAGSALEPDDVRARGERMLLRKLRTRSLSLREARRALTDAEIDDAVAEEILADFEGNGYLDDARLAEQLLDNALGRKAQGATAIARTLSQRGLDREVIDIALASMPDDEADRALDFARQRARGMSGLDHDVALRRLHGQLARRGFSGSLAMNAARQALAETDG